MAVLQLVFEGGARKGTFFVWPYKNDRSMSHVMCLESKQVTKYNPMPQLIHFHAKFPLVIMHGKHLQIKEQDK